MKLARVFVIDHPHGNQGDILDVIDPENHPGKLLGSVLQEVEVEDDFDPAVVSATVHTEKWTKEGEDDVYTDPEDPEWTHVEGSQQAGWFITFAPDQDKVDAANAAAVADQIAQKKRDLDAAVYADVKSVFGTLDPNSAAAFEKTWTRMVAVPSMFSSKGLTVHKELLAADDTVLFNKGDALDDDTKITTFATRKLEQVDEITVSRMEKIETYAQEVDALLNPS